MKYKGYVGKQSKNRTRNKYIFAIFFIIIVFFIYLYIKEKNLTESSNNIMKIEENNIMKIEENLIYEDRSLQLTELKTKILEYNQKLQLRNRLIKSLKDQLKNLEKNNNELLESIEFQSIKLTELANAAPVIPNLGISIIHKTILIIVEKIIIFWNTFCFPVICKIYPTEPEIALKN